MKSAVIKTHFIIVCFLLVNPVTAFSESLNQDFQTWGNITALVSLGKADSKLKNVKLWLEGQGRFGEDSSQFSQGILRPGIGYYVKKNISLWLGYGWIPNNPPAPSQDFDEHRIWQQLLWTEQFDIGKFMSRTRLEQRFDDRGDDVGWRFRQFFKFYQPIKYVPNLSWVLWDEVFVDINKTDWKSTNGFDQNRVFAGLGYQINQHARTELGYINQYIRGAQTDSMNHILSVNLFLSY